MFTFEMLTLIALVMGPTLAVLVTRMLDDRRARADRRYQLYKALMDTRRNKLSASHLNALNLIELEFNTKKKVIAAWREYLRNLAAIGANNDQWQQIMNEREVLFTQLISEITAVLRIGSVNQINIMKGGYVPQHWESAEDEAAVLRQGLLQVLRGEAALPVMLSPGYEEPRRARHEAREHADAEA